jgi:site-specific DNA recombinase
LSKRYDELKARIDELYDQISEMKAKKAGIEDFLAAFEKTPDTLTEFSVKAFSSLVDFITVYSEKDIRVTF